ncbi:MAG: hypothetical protein SVU32_01395, partial [Candidatus Nanohaloarchaea archaeon]|nr:hypothetical protein [Candidatus Nanohaloarchaea archaeon]
ITVRDAAGNIRTRKTSLTVDLITRRPGFYWNRVHGLNLSTSPVHTCSPSCIAVVRLRNHGSLSGRIKALNVSHSFS